MPVSTPGIPQRDPHHPIILLAEPTLREFQHRGSLRGIPTASSRPRELSVSTPGPRSRRWSRSRFRFNTGDPWVQDRSGFKGTAGPTIYVSTPGWIPTRKTCGFGRCHQPSFNTGDPSEGSPPDRVGVAAGTRGRVSTPGIPQGSPRFSSKKPWARPSRFNTGNPQIHQGSPPHVSDHRRIACFNTGTSFRKSLGSSLGCATKPWTKFQHRDFLSEVPSLSAKRYGLLFQLFQHRDFLSEVPRRLLSHTDAYRTWRKFQHRDFLSEVPRDFAMPT